MDPLYRQHLSGISLLLCKKKKRGTKPANHQFNDLCKYISMCAHAQEHAHTEQ